ncbi:MAG: FitA-like ribbon-helix-helix domain-containing protein [Waterburya sp.]
MTNITVRNIPEEVYQEIKNEASRNKRSINSEIILRLKKGCTNEQADRLLTLEKIRQLRNTTKGRMKLTEEIISQARLDSESR